MATKPAERAAETIKRVWIIYLYSRWFIVRKHPMFPYPHLMHSHLDFFRTKCSLDELVSDIPSKLLKPFGDLIIFPGSNLHPA